MFKKFIIVIGIFLACPSLLSADTVYLKNGKAVEGEIIEKKPVYIIIQVSGVPYKYYKQQIDRIEEKKKEPAASVEIMSLGNLEVEGVSEEKVKLIVGLIEVTGIRVNMEKNFQALLAQAPAERKQELEKLLDIKAILKKIIPIYDKYYSPTELKELIDFYHSSLGVKVLEVTPKIFKESTEVSIQYFKENSASP